MGFPGKDACFDCDPWDVRNTWKLSWLLLRQQHWMNVPTLEMYHAPKNTIPEKYATSKYQWNPYCWWPNSPWKTMQKIPKRVSMSMSFHVSHRTQIPLRIPWNLSFISHLFPPRDTGGPVPSLGQRVGQRVGRVGGGWTFGVGKLGGNQGELGEGGVFRVAVDMTWLALGENASLM